MAHCCIQRHCQHAHFTYQPRCHSLLSFPAHCIVFLFFFSSVSLQTKESPKQILCNIVVSTFLGVTNEQGSKPKKKTCAFYVIKEKTLGFQRLNKEKKTQSRMHTDNSAQPLVSQKEIYRCPTITVRIHANSIHLCCFWWGRKEGRKNRMKFWRMKSLKSC